MAGKERSVQIVDKDGVVKSNLDGDLVGGPQGPKGYSYPDTIFISKQLLAASVDQHAFTVPNNGGNWRLVSVSSMISVSGGSSAAVDVKVVDAVTAVASGTTQLTAPLDLEETAPNKQVGTLIASLTLIIPGMSVGLDFSGTLTGLVGNITLELGRIG